MQDYYKLEKCEIWELTISKEKIDIFIKEWLNKYSDFEYLYWDKVKHKKIPEGFKDHKELWGFIKFMRSLNYITPVRTEKEKHFRFWELPFSQHLLHEIDKNASGTFFTSFSDSDKRMFVANWMLEEAISSSQLEWAATTTKDAEKMIKQWRKPNTKDEQMIMNNYNAMMFIKNDLVKKDLEESDLLELQTILTKGTLENEDEVWRLRKNSDDIVIEFERKIVHTPMNEDLLHVELKRLINFANNTWDTETFVHPIIKAIIIHFWIWYLHPFCDWNGRTARAIFYWYVLKNDYFGFSFLPLSSIIKASPKDYAKAYIYSEYDNEDLTYFINYNLRKIKASLEKFKDDVTYMFEENHKVLKGLLHIGVNERQAKLISHFLNNKDSFTTTKTHKNYYAISKGTSITDLKNLEERWFLYSIKSWRNIRYFPIDNLEELIKKD